MPSADCFYCATCHNFKPLSIIIMDDGDQYFAKIINFMSKFFHNFLIDG